jgi:hypothetical protein
MTRAGHRAVRNHSSRDRLDQMDSAGFGLAAGALLGTLLGMRHALEPDHLAAISTLITIERSGVKAAWLGAWWGLGHTLTLMIAGALLIVMQAEMPARAASIFELGVMLLLIGFGLRALYLGARRAPGVHTPRLTAARPLLVGAVHGLAGSGAIAALVVTTLPSTAARIAYLLLFGAGSTLGMTLFSGVVSWPLARLGSHPMLMRSVSMAVGCISIALGLFWAYPILAAI